MPRYADEKELEIVHAPWWAEGEEVAIRRLSYGEDQRIMKAVSVVDREAGLVVVDYAEYRVSVMARFEAQAVRGRRAQPDRAGR